MLLILIVLVSNNFRAPCQRKENGKLSSYVQIHPRPEFSRLHVETTGSSQGLPTSHGEKYSNSCLDYTGDPICQSFEILSALWPYLFSIFSESSGKRAVVKASWEPECYQLVCDAFSPCFLQSSNNKRRWYWPVNN